ncbi:bestrophin family protein [Emticicia sp. TH156]|uniref:bestrophin family protein n=1 Tax=Emticicia sp. TH156 TaxID=2067454 RepID=UPI0021010510|nr:bestrophin family protein [Emticicia sp. TH156]
MAFFLGFRMNSAYDRWWEARKIFGELTNNTRGFVTKIYVYFGNPENLRENAGHGHTLQAAKLIDMAVLYIRQLKNEMHHNFKSVFSAESKQILDELKVDTGNKISNEILVALAVSIEAGFSEKANVEKGDLMQHINRFYKIQGKAERIRNTPFLMIYSAFTRIIVSFYVVLIPVFIGDIDLGGENSGFELLAIPIMVIISSAFLTINKLANLFGEPFSENKTSVTINEICQTIEQNCNEIRNKIKP